MADLSPYLGLLGKIPAPPPGIGRYFGELGGLFPPEQAAATQGAAITRQPAPPMSNVETRDYGPSVPRFATGPSGEVVTGRQSAPLSPRLAGGNLAAGAYNTEPGRIDPLSLTANQMEIDQRLRESFAQRELEPLQEAAQRSQLELMAGDPLAKERLMGQMDIQRAQAPIQAQRQYDLQDEQLLLKIRPQVMAELSRDPEFIQLQRTNPAEARAYAEKQIGDRLDAHKTARGKFTERLGGFGSS